MWMVVEWGVLVGSSVSVELGAVVSGYWCGQREVMWMMVECGKLVGRIGSVEFGDWVGVNRYGGVGGSGNGVGDGNGCGIEWNGIP